MLRLAPKHPTCASNRSSFFFNDSFKLLGTSLLHASLRAPTPEASPRGAQNPPAGEGPAPWHSRSHPAAEEAGASRRSHPRHCGFQTNTAETPAAWEQGGMDGRGRGLAPICTPRGAPGGLAGFWRASTGTRGARWHRLPALGRTRCERCVQLGSVPSPLPCRAGSVPACVAPCLSFPLPWIRCPLGAPRYFCLRAPGCPAHPLASNAQPWGLRCPEPLAAATRHL